VLTVATILLLFSNASLWQTAIGPMHNMEKTNYPFSDMHARLRMADRAASGYDINQDFGNNKPLYTVAAMKWLGLNPSNKVPVSIFFIGLFSFWNLWLLRPQRAIELFFSLAVLLSPPCLMLIERANDDIIIYSFICAVPLLLKLNSNLGRLCAWVGISALVPMKYYPAAAYALLLHREHSSKRLTFFVLLSLAFLATFFFVIWQELTVIHDRIPVAAIFCSLGGRLLFDSMFLDSGVGKIWVFCGFGGLLCWVAFVLFRAEPRATRDDPLNESYFLLGSSILTFCFFMNGNWDYRMAFLIPTIPLVFKWLSSNVKKERFLAAIYMLSMLLTLWPEYVYYSSVLESDNRWVHQKDLHIASIRLKHAASWVMIGSQMLIASYVLQPDIRLIISDLRASLHKGSRAKS